MAHARAHGVPVPEVFDVAGCDIVMEWADGPTMLTVLGRRPLTFRRQARLLARLRAVVHAVPAPEWLPAPFGDAGGAQVLLQRDLHPQNVILTAGGPQIGVRTVQGLFTRSFLATAGPVDRDWLAATVRQRLADPHLLPPERVRVERLRVA
jgi:aminoglycoside phosphotransferase (APT) family kinase protein